MAEEVEKPEDAAAVIKEYEDIIWTMKKGTIIHCISPSSSN